MVKGTTWIRIFNLSGEGDMTFQLTTGPQTQIYSIRYFFYHSCIHKITIVHGLCQADDGHLDLKM